MGCRRSAVLLGVWLLARPAAAQQGLVQVSAATQVTTGDPVRVGDQPMAEPDLALTVRQPGLPVGTLDLELHLTRRRDRLHLGRALATVSALKIGGWTWRIDLGDTTLSPAVSDYGFVNLFAPPVSVNGISLSATRGETRVDLLAGRATALRNIFGSDPETLGQTVVLARFVHQPHPRLRLYGRASGVQTTDLGEFTYTVERGRDAGAGFVVRLLPQLEVVADAGLTRYRRRGAPVSAYGPSALLGARWSFARGWIQTNVQQFAPGAFPVLNFPFADRRGAFASGELEVTGGMRLFGGVDAVATNLIPEEARLVPGTTPPGELTRTFGGVRMRVAGRSFLTVRLEQGARLTRPLPAHGGLADLAAGSTTTRFDSDTGLVTAEWQTAARAWNLVARATRRTNVDVGIGRVALTQDEAALQVFHTPSPSRQAFASAVLARQRTAGHDRQVFWQANLGGQVRLTTTSLYARVEATAARTYDFDHGLVTTRRALGLSLTGQLTSRTSVGLYVLVDRTPLAFVTGSPWLTRSMVRVTRTFPTGVAPVVGRPAVVRRAGGAHGTITGMAYADWNANGRPDPDEEPVAGIAVLLGASTARTGSDGRFAFVEVPAGPALVSLDLTAVPASFDPPPAAAVSVTVSPSLPALVSFGLVPLGAISGRVLHDANGNGRADPDDTPVDEIVLLLDGGQRTELTRDGRFRFDAVRAGAHEVELLLDSLEPGTAIVGDARTGLVLTRERPEAQVEFLIRRAQRAEIRRVFPARSAAGPTQPPSPGPSTPAAPSAGPAGRTAGTARPSPPTGTPVPASAQPSRSQPTALTVQVSAMRNPQWVKALVDTLQAKGYPVYTIEPQGADDFYRVRVGRFRHRADAERMARRLRADEGLAGWITHADRPAAR